MLVSTVEDLTGHYLILLNSVSFSNLILQGVDCSLFERAYCLIARQHLAGCLFGSSCSAIARNALCGAPSRIRWMATAAAALTWHEHSNEHTENLDHILLFPIKLDSVEFSA